MGEINKWPQGMVKNTAYPEVKKKITISISLVKYKKMPLRPRYPMVPPSRKTQLILITSILV